MVFVDLFTERGLDRGTPAIDESTKMAGRAARSPARLCSRDRKLCFYRRLEYDFLACLLCFLFFFFLSVLIPVRFSSSCCLVRAAAICASSASTCASCVIHILSHLRIPFVLLVLFFVVVIFLVSVLVVISYPVCWHLICLL